MREAYKRTAQSGKLSFEQMAKDGKPILSIHCSEPLESSSGEENQILSRFDTMGDSSSSSFEYNFTLDESEGIEELFGGADSVSLPPAEGTGGDSQQLLRFLSGCRFESETIDIGHFVIHGEGVDSAGLLDVFGELRRWLYRRTDEFGNSRFGGVLLISLHETDSESHLHLVHECRTKRQTRSCRCFFSNGGVRFSRPLRFKRAYHRREAHGYFTGCSIYLQGSEDERRRILLFMDAGADRTAEFVTAVREYQRSGLQPERAEFFPCDSKGFQSGGSTEVAEAPLFRCRRSAEEGETFGPTTSKKVRTTRFQVIDYLRQLFRQYRPSSFNKISQYVDYSDPKGFSYLYKSISKRNELNEIAWNLETRAWNETNFAFKAKDMFESFKFRNPDISPENSARLIYSVLFFQFGTHELVKEFIDTVEKSMDKGIPKKNTLQIVGQPNSGKTFIADTISAVMWNVGKLANPGKYTTFPFNDCPNKALIYWNEPVLGKDYVEDFLKILGGEEFGANIKYQSNVNISHTPVIATGNRNFWFLLDKADISRLACRCNTFSNWTSCTDLKYINCKPDPSGWHIILEAREENNLESLLRDFSYFYSPRFVIDKSVPNMYHEPTSV